MMKQSQLLVSGLFARKIVNIIQNQTNDTDTLKRVDQHIQSILRGYIECNNYSTSYYDIIDDLRNYGKCLQIIEKIIPDVKFIKKVLDYVLTMLSEVHLAIQTNVISKEKLKKTYEYYNILRTYCVNNFVGGGCW